MRGNNFRSRNFDLHDEMLLQTHLYDGGLRDDLDFGFKIAQRATEYGIDGFSGPQVLAFGLELKEAGILPESDFEGMPSDNEGKFYWLLDRVVRREGIGDVLANGTHWAAEQIGNGAMAFVIIILRNMSRYLSNSECSIPFISLCMPPARGEHYPD